MNNDYFQIDENTGAEIYSNLLEDEYVTQTMRNYNESNDAWIKMTRSIDELLECEDPEYFKMLHMP